jgi:hypothetical protein
MCVGDPVALRLSIRTLGGPLAGAGMIINRATAVAAAAAAASAAAGSGGFAAGSSGGGSSADGHRGSLSGSLGSSVHRSTSGRREGDFDAFGGDPAGFHDPLMLPPGMEESALAQLSVRVIEARDLRVTMPVRMRARSQAPVPTGAESAAEQAAVAAATAGGGTSTGDGSEGDSTAAGIGYPPVPTPIAPLLAPPTAPSPYAVLFLCDQLGRTAAVPASHDPYWDEPFTFRVTEVEASSALQIAVFDQSANPASAFLGMAYVPLSLVECDVCVDRWILLRGRPDAASAEDVDTQVLPPEYAPAAGTVEGALAMPAPSDGDDGAAGDSYGDAGASAAATVDTEGSNVSTSNSTSVGVIGSIAGKKERAWPITGAVRVQIVYSFSPTSLFDFTPPGAAQTGLSRRAFALNVRRTQRILSTLNLAGIRDAYQDVMLWRRPFHSLTLFVAYVLLALFFPVWLLPPLPALLLLFVLAGGYVNRALHGDTLPMLGRVPVVDDATGRIRTPQWSWDAAEEAAAAAAAEAEEASASAAATACAAAAGPNVHLQALLSQGPQIAPAAGAMPQRKVRRGLYAAAAADGNGDDDGDISSASASSSSSVFDGAAAATGANSRSPQRAVVGTGSMVRAADAEADAVVAALARARGADGYVHPEALDGEGSDEDEGEDGVADCDSDAVALGASGDEDDEYLQTSQGRAIAARKAAARRLRHQQQQQMQQQQPSQQPRGSVSASVSRALGFAGKNNAASATAAAAAAAAAERENTRIAYGRTAGLPPAAIAHAPTGAGENSEHNVLDDGSKYEDTYPYPTLVSPTHAAYYRRRHEAEQAAATAAAAAAAAGGADEDGGVPPASAAVSAPANSSAANPGLVMQARRFQRALGDVQARLGDFCTLFEQAESLLTWQDPRRSSLLLKVALAASVAFLLLPTRLVLVVIGVSEFTAFFRRPHGPKAVHWSLSERLVFSVPPRTATALTRASLHPYLQVTHK